ncbi:ABC transporter permease [Cellulomonas sp. 179-A 4D5 NHS]|uniref:ABC transporter permease n=1 Tax=Cellulomonas sp. 179-A 4D5 NHS TaxID=3142378 RepID=UPI00399F167D
MTTTTLAPRTALHLTLLHARFQFLETVRVPIAVIGNLLFPSLAMFFFVVPQPEVSQNPGIATAAAAQLATFAIISTCLFSFGAGVAEDRALPFDPYLRTLPAGAAPRLAGRVVNGIVWCLLALVPLIVIAVVFTEATITPQRLLLALACVPLVALPFLMLGLAIGYALSNKAAIAVVQAVLFPLAFAGGLFMPPEVFPGWMNAMSRALPTRAARDLVIEVATGYPAYVLALPVLLGWTVLFGALAVTAYRRDEGRRFR